MIQQKRLYKKHWIVATVILFCAIAAVYFLFRSSVTSRLVFNPQVAGAVSVDSTSDVRATGYSGQRKIDLDSEGNIVVAYRSKVGEDYQIFVATLIKNGELFELTEPMLVSAEMQSTTQRVPSISIDNKNHIHLVWYGGSAGSQENRQIRYVRSGVRENMWTKQKVVSYVEDWSQEEDYWQEHPSIYAAEDNTLYTVWEGKTDDNDEQQVKFSKSYDNGETWSEWKNINESREHTRSRPEIVEDSSGRLHLVLYTSEDSLSGEQAIQYSYSDDEGESWSDFTEISGGLREARHASLSFSGDTAHVAFRAQPSRNARPDELTRIYYTFGSGGTWSEPVPISSPTADSYHFFPSLGVGDDGSICIVWHQTSNKSGFPQESPTSGDIYGTCIVDGIFREPVKLTDIGNALYPNIPQRYTNMTEVPVLFTNSDNETVALKWLGESLVPNF